MLVMQFKVTCIIVIHPLCFIVRKITRHSFPVFLAQGISEKTIDNFNEIKRV